MTSWRFTGSSPVRPTGERYEQQFFYENEDIELDDIIFDEDDLELCEEEENYEY